MGVKCFIGLTTPAPYNRFKVVAAVGHRRSLKPERKAFKSFSGFAFLNFHNYHRRRRCGLVNNKLC